MNICLNQDGQDLQDEQGSVSCKSFYPEYPDSDSVDKPHDLVGVDFEYISLQAELWL